MNFVKTFNLLGIEAKQTSCIELHGAPTTATEGAVGLLGMDIDSESHDLYKCVAVENGEYTWEIVSSVPDWAKQPTKPTYTAAEVGAATSASVNAQIFSAIDQSYDSTSTNAQSGTAVAEAIDGIVYVGRNVGSYNEFFEGVVKGNILRWYGDAEKITTGASYDFYTTDYIQVYAGDVLHYKLSGIVNVSGVTSSLFHVYDMNKEVKAYIRPKVSNTLTEGIYSFAEDGFIRLCHGVYDASGLTEVLNGGEVYIERYATKKDVNEIINEIVNDVAHENIGQIINGDKFNIAVLSDSIFSLVGGTNALDNETTILDYLKEKVDCNCFNGAVHGSCAYGRASDKYKLDFVHLVSAIKSGNFNNQINALGVLEALNTDGTQNTDIVIDKMTFLLKVSKHTQNPFKYAFVYEGDIWKIKNASTNQVLATTQNLSEYGLNIPDNLTEFNIKKVLNYQSHMAIHLQTIIDLCNKTNDSGKNPEYKTFADMDILIINYGGNDYLNHITAEKTKTDLSNGIKDLLDKYPNLKIVVNAPYYQFIPSQKLYDATVEYSEGIQSVSITKPNPENNETNTIGNINFMSKYGTINGNDGKDRMKFIYNGTTWTFNGVEDDISQYEITIDGEVTNGSYIVIVWEDSDCMSAENANNQGLLLKDYVSIEKEVAEEFCLPFFDNLTHFGWNKYNKINYFYRNDGLHPRETGAYYIANKLYENLKAAGLLGINRSVQ